MTKRIFRSTILVAAFVLLCSIGLVMGVLYDYFAEVQMDQLRDELRIAAAGTQLEGIQFLSALEAEEYRITWVAEDGTVIYDTGADAPSMGNHLDREEIKEALEFGTGSSTRQSATSLERTVYEAVKLIDGSVLRISMSQKTMLILIVGMLRPVAIVIAITAIVSAVLAHHMSKKIVKPLNDLDLEHPLQNEIYEEITPLLQRINRQHLQIGSQMQELQQRADEFAQITANMQEGLVLLDYDGKIISANTAAKALFAAGSDCEGKSFLLIERGQEIRQAVNDALDSGCGRACVDRHGGQWQIDINRIESDGKVIGAALLAYDVTQEKAAERSRREFSANVSHELKTPLQSIMGSAELLENGMVRSEDVTRFVGYIRQEAARLLNLIQDIIRLSQLDEGVEMPAEQIDLLTLSREAAAVLQPTAEAANVTVTVEGSSCVIGGVKRLLYEIVYNLCDNAIKYNVPGGSVRIHVENSTLTVSDTGIGIPMEHQGSVFERFYRVDKSHSRSSGGTGLGLSIVKHAAQYHDAQLQLESTPGKGTAVTVRF